MTADAINCVLLHMWCCHPEADLVSCKKKHVFSNEWLCCLGRARMVDQKWLNSQYPPLLKSWSDASGNTFRLAALSSLETCLMCKGQKHLICPQYYCGTRGLNLNDSAISDLKLSENFWTIWHSWDTIFQQQKPFPTVPLKLSCLLY